MTQTITRELRNKFQTILNKYPIQYPACLPLLDELVASALEVRGIAKSQLPPGSGLAWGIAAGLSSEQIVAEETAFAAEKVILDAYERAMKYPPLAWYSDKKFEKLRRFLTTKTIAEIETFAKWANRDYSKFDSVSAKRFPDDVITFWGLAVKEDESRSLASEERI